MANYWIGIVGSSQDENTFEKRSWWCFPISAQKGDYIYMYCPRSISNKNQGIFALCRINKKLDQNHENNHYCAGYGKTFNKGPTLFYGSLKFLKRYKLKLTAKEMKRDIILGKSKFVRRNFQGTTFNIDDAAFNRIKELLKEKNR